MRNIVGKEPPNTCRTLDKIIECSEEVRRGLEQMAQELKDIDDWAEEVRSINSELREQRAAAIEEYEKLDEENDDLRSQIAELESKLKDWEVQL